MRIEDGKKMMTLVAATQNEHKIKEIEAITKEFDINIISRGDAGVPDVEIIEDGTTFEENSYKKAYEIMKLSNMPAVADDSGLEVDALDGAPGVYSARFSGVDGDDEANNAKLLELLKDLPMDKRTARYVAVITLIFPGDKTIVCRGECEGHIMFEESGSNGFGYDPLFRPLGYDVSFGHIPSEEKNKISHRAKALVLLKEKLKELDG